MSQHTDTTYKPTSPNSKLDFASVWEYAPAPESASHAEIKEKYDLFIGGKFVKPAEGNYFKSMNPATGETITEFAEASKSDVNKAVKTLEKHLKVSGVPFLRKNVANICTALHA